MPVRIVITGAPGSGKTAALDLLKSDESFSNFLFFNELARQLLTENPDYRNRWSEFHREIYRQQTKREDACGGLSFITDRGTVDAFAFHPETLNDVSTTLEREYARYSTVLQLGSTASLGDAYYRTDDIRQESAEDAMSIEHALTRVWSGHQGYQFIPAQETWPAKYAACRTALEILMHQKNSVNRILNR